MNPAGFSPCVSLLSIFFSFTLSPPPFLTAEFHLPYEKRGGEGKKGKARGGIPEVPKLRQTEQSAPPPFYYPPILPFASAAQHSSGKKKYKKEPACFVSAAACVKSKEDPLKSKVRKQHFSEKAVCAL